MAVQSGPNANSEYQSVITIKENYYQSIDTNSSYVTVVWTAITTNTRDYLSNHKGELRYSVKGGVETVVECEYALKLNEYVTVLELPIWVSHGKDGTATLQITGTLNAGELTNSETPPTSHTATFELEPISRASSIEVMSNTARIGDRVNVQINRRRYDTAHVVKYEFVNKSGYLSVSEGILSEPKLLYDDQFYFDVPLDFYEEIPDVTSGVCRLICSTYVQNAQGQYEKVYSDTATEFRTYIDDERCRPGVTGDAWDKNPKTLEMTLGDLMFVRYHSIAVCTIWAEPQNYARIVKRWINGIEIVDESVDTIEIPNIQQDTITFEALDSRGLRSKYIHKLNFIPYVHLTNEPSADRSGPTSNEINLGFKGKVYECNFGGTDNVLSLSYRIDSGDEVPIDVFSIYDTDTELSEYAASVLLPEMDYRRTFEITFIAADKLERVEKTIKVKKGIPVFDWGENDFKFHVPVDIDFEGASLSSLSIGGVCLLDLIYPKGIKIAFNGNVDPNVVLGGTWNSLSENTWMRID